MSSEMQKVVVIDLSSEDQKSHSGESTISVIIPKNTFTPGETISGAVLCRIDHLVRVGALTVLLSGEESIQSSSDCSQQFLRKELRLEVENENSDMVLQKGVHRIPFSIEIPNNLPLSMILENVSVEYSLEASLWTESDDLCGSPSMQSYHTIHINGGEYHENDGQSLEKTTVFPLEHGQLSLSCRVNSHILEAGSDVTVQVEVQNDSATQLSEISVSFLQIVGVKEDEFTTTFEQNFSASSFPILNSTKNRSVSEEIKLRVPDDLPETSKENSPLQLSSIRHSICFRALSTTEEWGLDLPIILVRSFRAPPPNEEGEKGDDSEIKVEETEEQTTKEAFEERCDKNQETIEKASVIHSPITRLASTVKNSDIDHYHLFKNLVFQSEDSVSESDGLEDVDTSEGSAQQSMTPSPLKLPELRSSHFNYSSPSRKEYRISFDQSRGESLTMAHIRNHVEETRRKIQTYSNIIHQYDSLKPGQPLTSMGAYTSPERVRESSPSKLTEPPRGSSIPIEKVPSERDSEKIADQPNESLSVEKEKGGNQEEETEYEYETVESKTEPISSPQKFKVSEERRDFSSIGQYCGELVKGLPHGLGEMKYNNGSRYEGSWSNGKKQGKGKMDYSDGALYDGHWIKDKRHGWGFYKTALYNYDGQWEHDRKQGKGLIVYNNNEQYEGQWVENYPEGRGSYVFQDGSTYKGEFKRGLRHGRGILAYANSTVVYDGDFEYDRKSGQAVITFQNGTYTGEMANDVRSGYGIYRYSNGDTYEGEWVNNKKEGTGVMNYATGGYFKGHWNNGIRYGRGEHVASDGTRFIEVWENGSLLERVRL